MFRLLIRLRFLGKAIGFHVNGCGYKDFVGHAGVIAVIFVLFRKLILYAQRIREKIIPSFAGWTEAATTGVL